MLSQEQQEKQIGALLKKPQNALCADCSSKSPCWASLDFGVFVCMNCSGAHRSLGQSVTRIKSTKLDTWNKQWLWHMQLDNKLINEYYEAQKTMIYNRKPNPNSSLVEIKKFVYDKYVRKLFALQGEDDPITNLKNGKHPIKKNLNQEQKNSTKTQQGKKYQESQQKGTTKSVNQPITVKQPKKIENLLDDVSDISNRGPSIQNQRIRQQINLFEQGPGDVSSHQNHLNPAHNLYNKEHFNSFSGKGAQHSSTGHVTFDSIFEQNTHSHSSDKNKNISFDEFKTITTTGNNLSTQNQGHAGHYGHIHHHHYPHLHIYSTTVGGGHQSYYYNNPPTHVTMNINMNINLNDTTSKPSASTNTQVNINEHIKLDLNDFAKLPQEKPKQTIKSWVDDWK